MNTITISGVKFTVPSRYSAGHVVTAGEADALNQTLWENIRNNRAPHVKKAVEAGADHASMQADVDAYAESYQFGVRGTNTDAVLLAFARKNGFESVEAMNEALAVSKTRRSRAA